MSPRKRRLAESLKSIYLWHRYTGLVMSLTVIWLALTGMLLNHTEDFALSKQYVGNDALLNLYGIHPVSSVDGFALRDRWISAIDGMMFLDQRVIAGDATLIGAIPTSGGFVVATDNALQLYSNEAELLETIAMDPKTGNIIAIGHRGTDLLIRTERAIYASNEELLEFRQIDAFPVDADILQMQPLPTELSAAIADHARRHTLTWERVFLDLHSGRIFGRLGIWIMDITAIAIMLLAISGLLVWYRRMRQRHAMRHD